MLSDSGTFRSATSPEREDSVEQEDSVGSLRRGAEPSGYLFVLPWSFSVLSGGVNQVVLNLAREMQRAGSFTPIVLCADWSATEPVWETVHGIKTVRWRIRPFDQGSGWKSRVAYWLWEKRFQSRFARFCSEWQIRAVNLHYVGPLAFTLSRLCRNRSPHLPLLLSFHGQDVTDLQNASRAVVQRWRDFLPHASAAVVCSRNLGDRLVHAVGGDIAPVVVYNGIDERYFTGLSRAATKPAGRRYILNVGRFQRKKGQDVLIKAFVEIADQYPDLDLVLVGASDHALPELRELCIHEAIQERVHFHPDRPHEEIADFLRDAVLFVLPSRSEGFAIVLLEAGVLGVPVVASRVGGIPELITDGETGSLVPPDSPLELARALQMVLDDPDRRRAMAARLYKDVSTKFTWEVAQERYRQIAAAAMSEALVS